MTPHSLVIHHSASPLSTTPEDIDKWHKERGWKGVGYHWVIESDGTIRGGRSIDQCGAHAPPNRGRLGVCVVGNNLDPDQQWTANQWHVLGEIVRGARVLVPGIEIHAHRDLRNTECPGLELSEILAHI